MVTVTHFDIHVDVTQLKEDALKVVRHIKKDWMNKEISVTFYTDGITNRLIGCYLPEDKDNVILIRVYGEKTELFIDRNREKLNMKLMHDAGLAPPLFASFKNGLCYGFTPGKPIDYDRVRDPLISKFIADKMARMHSLVKPKRTPSFCAASGCPPNCSSPTSAPHPIPEACLFREEGGTLVKYLDLLRDCDFHSKGRRQSSERLFYRKEREIPSWERLESEVSFLKTLLTPLNSPVVFCHNDLLLKNIIYHKTPTVGVTFIDFEYADFNFQAFDIANHFCEFAGVDEYDPTLFPDENFQRDWIKHYLRSWKQHNPPSPCDDTSEIIYKSSNGHHPDEQTPRILTPFDVEVTDEEVDVLLSQIKKFTLASHLMWGTWALIQSRHSNIQFHFLSYAMDRLNQYFEEKSKLPKMETNGHSKM